MSGDNSTGVSDRLFVPLKTEHYRAFESGEKDVELRGLSDQFNPETVVPGRPVELRRGYATPDSLWGVIEHVWNFDHAVTIPRRLDHERILPGATEDEFLASVEELLGDYQRYIAFHPRLESGGQQAIVTDGGVPEDESETWRAAVSAYGAVSVDVEEDEDPVEALNQALAAVDTGDLASMTMDYVTNETTGERFEQNEARKEGVDY